jgi:predicted O-methyltransferase YrrM
MSPDATLTTVEKDTAVQAVARRHLGHDPRTVFVTADADTFLDDHAGDGSAEFDLAFVDCRPGKFHRLPDLLHMLAPGALYITDDLMPQSTWPSDHQERVCRFLTEAPTAPGLVATPLAWASGLLVATRI